MSAWLERVRAALAPKGYDVDRELASGGMGTVFLARQRRLARLVAIKIIRPELYTARAAERFRAEAQILARFHHPNIVTVYDADEADGLPYYVMEYLRGDTLADRLREGPLPVPEARKLGRDFLDALGAAHKRGVIHRDVKPGNVFLVDGLGVLVDFGIAKQVAAGDTTDPGFTLGTAAYMAPEQFARVEADERTDIYAAGMVIYEAFTGRRWDKGPAAEGNWSGFPPRVPRVVRRGLELDPKDRWPDAASFRRALWRTRIWPYRRNTIGVAVGCTAVGILVGVGVLRPAPSTTLHLRVDAGDSPLGLPGLGDSVACGLARALDRYPELSAHCTSGLAGLWPGGSRVRPVIENDGGRARIRLASAIVALDTIWITGTPAQWSGLVDSLADRVFGALLGTRKLLDPALPAIVLPKTQAGRLEFQRAERFFALARWGAARAAYAAAAVLDSTCWLCYWRHAEVGRWFDLADDPTDSARYVAHAGAFPAYYQSLIRAEGLPEAQRLDSLDALTRRWKNFLFGQFRRGDELLHRGPLVGRPRREAMAAFGEALRIQPDFGPALQHVAWLDIAEGDSAEATGALARVERLADPKDASFATLALVELAYAWRFLPHAAALQRTEALVRTARAAGIVDLDAGARYLAGFGAPQGELALAERLVREPGFERSSELARVLALVGLGRPDSALALARALARHFPELTVFADELVAATLLFDVDSARLAVARPAARLALAGDADQRVGPPDRRWRARWMLGVFEQARHASSGRSEPVAGEPAFPYPLAALLQGQGLAARGAYAAAIAATNGLVGLPVQQTDDPFFRSVLHLSRADWYERAGRPANAQPELTWHENSDLFGYPTGDPQPAEVDWAFAPVTEWRLAVLSERSHGRVEEACHAYRVVARVWQEGEPRYRARADSAARRVAALGCREPR